MPTALGLVLAAVVTRVVGGIVSFALRRDEPRAGAASAVAGVAAAVLGLLGSLGVLLGGGVATASWAGPPALRLDAASALLVALLSLLSGAAAIYGMAYVREYAGRGIGVLGLHVGLLVGAMLLCVVSDDAATFLVALEVAGLACCFLVLFADDANAYRAGRSFFATTYGASILIVVAFFLLYRQTGSLTFASFRAATIPQPLASVVFLLALVGFGAKAGMMPFHGWIPREATAAPAHVSALISGGMAKVALFGLIRVAVEFLRADVLWWGLLVLAAGAASAVLGVMFAGAERDLKRMLARSTTENVGIILMGVGIGMVGLATGRPALGTLGLLAAFYHMLNHAMFKGLLFLGAGAVVSRVETRELDRMGGLARAMPGTGLACLVGSLAICALPPLNGFASEWFTYQALFDAAARGGAVVRLAAPLAMVALGITGALAAMAFVKFYGLAFAGEARTPEAAAATDVGRPMLVGMGILAVACVAFGLGAPLVAPVVRDAAAGLAGGAPAVVRGPVVFPGDPARAAVSPVLIGLLLAGALGVPVALSAYFAAIRPPRKLAREIWAVGYAPDASMNVSAEGFTEPIRMMFWPAFALRRLLEGEAAGPRPAVSAGAVPVASAAPARGNGRRAIYLLASAALLLVFFAALVVAPISAGGR
jgi:hydrogenase-4 component B